MWLGKFHNAPLRQGAKENRWKRENYSVTEMRLHIVIWSTVLSHSAINTQSTKTASVGCIYILVYNNTKVLI